MYICIYIILKNIHAYINISIYICTYTYIYLYICTYKKKGNNHHTSEEKEFCWPI